MSDAVVRSIEPRCGIEAKNLECSPDIVALATARPAAGSGHAHLDPAPDQLGGDTSLGSCRREEADVCVLRLVWGPPRPLGRYPSASSVAADVRRRMSACFAWSGIREDDHTLQSVIAIGGRP